MSDTIFFRCTSFVYGGCLGNDNNFLTAEECEDRCGRWMRQRPDDLTATADEEQVQPTTTATVEQRPVLISHPGHHPVEQQREVAPTLVQDMVSPSCRFAGSSYALGSMLRPKDAHLFSSSAVLPDYGVRCQCLEPPFLTCRLQLWN